MKPRTNPGTAERQVLEDKLVLELRRGALVLAALSRLGSYEYGYSLLEQLAQAGLGIEQGTLYPLLRRLDEQGLLESEWRLEEARPRKYYRLSPAGRETLRALTDQWNHLARVMSGLLEPPQGETSHGSH